MSYISKTNLAKTALSICTGIGTTSIVNSIVSAHIPEKSVPMKICIILAKVGIAGAIQDQVDRQVFKTVDAVVDAYQHQAKLRQGS